MFSLLSVAPLKFSYPLLRGPGAAHSWPVGASKLARGFIGKVNNLAFSKATLLVSDLLGASVTRRFLVDGSASEVSFSSAALRESHERTRRQYTSLRCHTY